MASPAAAAGRGTGFRMGLASARQRRIQDQEIERQRRLEDVRESRAAESHELGMEQSRFGLERARTEAQRADESYARTQEELQQRNQEEGVLDFVNALNEGVDPQRAMQLFNSKGSLQLTDVQIDPETNRIRLVDSDGEAQDFENPRQIAAAFGIPLQGPEQQDLMATDKPIYDPNKGEWIMPPQAEGGMSPKDRYEQVGDFLFDKETEEWLSPPGAGEGGGRDVSPYNPQTVQDDITAGVVRSMGGQFDAYGNYSFGGDEDRALGDYRISEAQQMAGRLEEHLKATRVTPGAIVNAVMEATRDVPSETELARRAEEWRTKGWNKSQEEAATWLANERRKARAEAEQRLADAEQTLLSQNARREPPPAFEKPDWAAEALPENLIAPDQLESGYEYDVDIDGRKATIRLGPDGRVYEVKGKPKGSQPKESQPQASASGVIDREEPADPVQSSLAQARRNRSEFVY